MRIQPPTATRRLQFCAGHRVFGHESKCAHLHGHNYVVLLTARVKLAYLGNLLRTAKTTNPTDPESILLDSIGRVVDFSVLKTRVGQWIDSHWDHGFILSQEDSSTHRLMEQAARNNPEHGQKVYIMPYNPTAENMARHLLLDVCPGLFHDSPVEICHVRVWETENCYADAQLADHNLVLFSTPE